MALSCYIIIACCCCSEISPHTQGDGQFCDFASYLGGRLKPSPFNLQILVLQKFFFFVKKNPEGYFSFLIDIPVLQNNITEIRTDAVKLLVILRRPIPRAAATIGAWMNIFQVNFYLVDDF